MAGICIHWQKTVLPVILCLVSFWVGAQPPAPGGVAGASIWLRADMGVTAGSGTVSQWNDQTGNGFNVSQATGTAQPVYNTTSGLVNFNPTLGFSNAIQYLSYANGIFGAGPYTAANAFALAQTNANSPNSSWGFGWYQSLTSGVTIGMNMPYTDGTLVWDGANPNRVRVAWGGTFGVPYLWSGVNNGSLASVRRNGLQLGTTAAAISYGNTGTTNPFIVGNNTGATPSFIGSMGELAVYTSTLTATQVQQIQSYYALKYGITLDQTTAYSYLASDGTTVVWDATANSGYKNNIAGIGRDDGSALIQRQSQSGNTAGSGNMLTIGLRTIATTNLANTGSFSADKSFLVWGDNGAAATLNSAVTPVQTDGTVTLPGGNPWRQLGRVWKVQVTGSGTGTVQVQINTAGTGLGAVSPASYYLAIDNNNSPFTTAAVTKLVAPTSMSGGVVTFNNVSFTTGQYFTVLQATTSPGGVSNGLQLWLRADAGVTTGSGTVSQWNDQSGNGFNVSQATGTAQPVYNTTSGLVNFNPTLGFSSAIQYLSYANGIFGPGPYTAANAFTLAQANVNSTNNQWGYCWYQNLTTGTGFGMNLPFTTGPSAVWDGPFPARILQPWGGTFGVPYLWSGVNSSSTESFRRNGLEFGTGALAISYGNTGTTNPFVVGNFNGGGTFGTTPSFIGSMGELAVYTYALTATQVEQIQSYYALKYGITLDQTTAYNYLASDGTTVVWDGTANSGYKNNIAGIGRDDNGGLYQRQSQSVNTSASGNMVTIGLGTIAATNLANTGSFSADKSFLVWGDNGAAATLNPTATPVQTDGTVTLGSNWYQLGRVWKVQATGSGTGAVQVQINTAGTGLSAVFPGSYYLAIDNNSSPFSTAAVTKLVAATSVSGGVITFNNVPFSTGQYFTVLLRTVGPGGVPGATIWLRADAGVTAGSGTVSQWNDQSGNGFNVTQATGTAQPVYNTTSGLVNFNPTLGFSNAIQFLSYANGIFGTGPYNAANAFTLAQTNANSTNSNWGQCWYQNLTSGGTFGMNLPWFNGNAVWDGSSTNARVLVPSWGGTFGVPYLWSGVNSSSSESFRRNGLQFGTNTAAISYGTTSTTNPFLIGNNANGGAFGTTPSFIGSMGEIAVYTSTLTATQVQQIQSYYALKYGITLDQTTAYNYLASDGTTVVWNATANSGYKNNVAGIGRDDGSALTQLQSQSVNTAGNGNMLTIGLGTIATTNLANTGSFSADKSFLVWGDNGSSVAGGDNTTDLPANYTSRVNRLWKTQVTGAGVGPAQVQFNLTGITHAGTASNQFVLVIKRGGANSTVLNESGATYVEIPAASYSSNIVTFTGVSYQSNDIFALIDGTSLCSTTATVALTSNGQTVNANNACQKGGWTYYYASGSPNTLYFALQRDPNNTGANASMTVSAINLTTSSDPTTTPYSSTSGNNGIFTLGRYWNVTANNMTSPVNVRFFFDPLDTAAALNAAQAFQGPSTTISNLQWFKTVGSAFSPSTSLSNGTFSGSVLQLTPAYGVQDGINYVEFDGVPSFSGGTGYYTVTNLTSLPLILEDFTGKLAEQHVLLNWTTAQESGTSRFEVQRSATGSDWTTIGTVAAAGNSNTSIGYSFVDAQPLSGSNFYRLKLIDLDGSADYSRVIMVMLNGQGPATPSVTPNPFQDGVTVRFTTAAAGEVTIRLTDMQGRTIRKQQWNAVAGENAVQWNGLAGLPQGIYLLVINDGSGKAGITRLVKL